MLNNILRAPLTVFKMSNSVKYKSDILTVIIRNNNITYKM